MNATGYAGAKLAAILVMLAMVFSSFLAVASPADQTAEETVEQYFSLEGDEAYGDPNAAPETEVETPQPVTTTAEGKFSPEPLGYGVANILLVDDDAERWMSGPYLEATHIETALNDGGYVYDVFRAGAWGSTNKEIPSGQKGLSILDDYEVIIWYSGWNTQILSSGELSVMKNYLDGTCGTQDTDCVPSNQRNVIQLTQMADWLYAYGSDYRRDYLMYTSRGSLIVDGTSNPMKGVSGSIFDNEEYSTNTGGVHYLSRPVSIGTSGKGAQGAFWYEMLKTTSNPYHAVQYPRTDGQPNTNTKTHKAFFFAEEIGVFDSRADRNDFFATILDWMGVDAGTQKNVDMGLGALEIPNHSQYWRVVEANAPIEIVVGVTNYGLLPQSSTAAHLRLKNQFGQILFDNTFDSRAFPPGHDMYVETILPGQTWWVTFNKTNDKLQLEYDGLDTSRARNVIFTSAGMDSLSVEVVHTGDQVSPNNYMSASVGVAKWVDNGELPENEHGPSITFYDTDDNGANSLDYVNNHRVHSYDWDDDGDYPGGANEGDGTENETQRSVYHQGDYALGMFNKNGWYKSSANPNNCDHDSSNGDCPKFTDEAWQDDVWMTPPMDFSAMDEVVLGILFTGRMESGHYWRMQVSKDGTSWTNLISAGFRFGKGSWYLWGGSNSRYQGYSLSSSYYGKEDTDTIYFRWQTDADGDQNTEDSYAPYMGMFVDEVIFRGTERITRDVAVTDVQVRSDGNEFKVKSQLDTNDREINATVLNAGEASWADLPVKFTVTNMQGEDQSHFLDDSEPTIANLPGNSKYGNIEAEGHEDQKELFALFAAPGANTYFITVEVLVPAGKDFFPWNNSMRVMFRVFDTFFSDNMESDITWTRFNRLSNDVNGFARVDARQYSAIGEASSGNWVRWYVNMVDVGSNEYTKNADSSFITPDTFDRDGAGNRYTTDVAVDLQAAFKPVLSFMLKHDLGTGDRLEVRAATDFKSDQKITSGTWEILTVAKLDGEEVAEDTPAVFTSESTGFPNQWIQVEISLEDYEGYQTFIDFHMIANTDSDVGTGAIIDDVMITGNEYRNNVDIVRVNTDRFSAAGTDHDLEIDIKSIGTELQEGVTVYAKITNSAGDRVWPTDRSWNFFEITTGLGKGQIFTVDPDVAGNSWKWGAGLDPGVYKLWVEAWRADEEQVPDESPAGNTRVFSIVLGAALLDGTQWSSNDWDDTDSENGAYSWDGSNSGTLESVEFTIWNKRPYFVVEADFDLTTANVKLQVKADTSGKASSGWVDVEWREITSKGEPNLYSIPGLEYDPVYPDSWTGSSYFDNATTHTFWADLGLVEDISTGTSLQDQYVGGEMTLRMVGTSGGGSGTFEAWNPSVFGLNRYAVDLTSITPTSQKANPSSVIAFEKRTFSVKIRNLGAVSDSGVVDFVITAPGQEEPMTLVLSNDKTEKAKIVRIEQIGRSTRVAIKPAGALWTDASYNPTDPLGDTTAYVAQDGTITWPSQTTAKTSQPGWLIDNPSKRTWNSGNNKPDTPSGNNYRDPGDYQTAPVIVTIGYAQWAPPNTYTIQADARSWEDYENTFTTNDPDGLAHMTIDKPDLYIRDHQVTESALGRTVGGVGWTKTSGGETDPYFYFEVEIDNLGTETVGTFMVGVIDAIDDSPLEALQVAVYWGGSGWKIDQEQTTATGAEVVKKGTRQYITFKATAVELGMSGPEDKNSATYSFFLAVDTGTNDYQIDEQNEKNNRVSFTITTVTEISTTPSFGLTVWGIMLAGLLAALGVALRREEEE